MAANPIKKAYNFLPVIPDVKVHPIYVWSRQQKESLYKTSNTIQHVNFYQKVDQLGLKTQPQFGIHGSPIHGADLNRDLTLKLGKDGHGAITYHTDLLEQFRQELLDLYQIKRHSTKIILDGNNNFVKEYGYGKGNPEQWQADLSELN